MRKQTLFLCAAVTVTGCGDVYHDHVAYPDGPDFTAKEATGPDEVAISGYDLCRKVTRSARARSIKDSAYGWIVGVIGASATAAGTIYPLAKSDPPYFEGKVFAASMTAGGLVLIAVSRAFFNRSDASSKLASITAGVLGESAAPDDKGKVTGRISDGDAGAKCNTALGAWESSRSDASAIATALLDKEKSDNAKQNAAAEASRDTLLNKMIDKVCPAGCTVEQLDSFRKMLAP